MNVLIVSSGEILNCELLKEEIKKNDYIICADGGLNHLLKINAIPDVVLGDLDSISKEGLDFIEDMKIDLKKFPTKKNMTDSELSVEFAESKNASSITLMGATGSRYDHSLANILLLKKIGDLGIAGKIINDNNIIRYVSSSLKLNKNPKFKYISIVPLDLKGAIVSLIGFMYPLDEYHIGYTSTIGISNELEDSIGEIIVHSGEILVIESKD